MIIGNLNALPMAGLPEVVTRPDCSLDALKVPRDRLFA